jgi:serine/threonine protein kinase
LCSSCLQLLALRYFASAAWKTSREITSAATAAIRAAATRLQDSPERGIAIARALAEVHGKGIVHRDVKPSNILLRPDGTPVLADFGLAREGDIAITQQGDFAGTPTYAAPERLRDGDLALDGRADVYSLGATLYEAISMAPPYQGRSTQEILRRIESGAVLPLPGGGRNLVQPIHQDDVTACLVAALAHPWSGPEALVIEDSLNGALAAEAAGCDCVVCPNPMTAHMTFTNTALIVESLADWHPTGVYKHFRG